MLNSDEGDNEESLFPGAYSLQGKINWVIAIALP